MLNDLEVSGNGLIVQDTVRMLGKVVMFTAVKLLQQRFAHFLAGCTI